MRSVYRKFYLVANSMNMFLRDETIQSILTNKNTPESVKEFLKEMEGIDPDQSLRRRCVI